MSWGPATVFIHRKLNLDGSSTNQEFKLNTIPSGLSGFSYYVSLYLSKMRYQKDMKKMKMDWYLFVIDCEERNENLIKFDKRK